jgi:hypothetical protein
MIYDALKARFPPTGLYSPRKGGTCLSDVLNWATDLSGGTGRFFLRVASTCCRLLPVHITWVVSALAPTTAVFAVLAFRYSPGTPAEVESTPVLVQQGCGNRETFELRLIHRQIETDPTDLFARAATVVFSLTRCMVLIRFGLHRRLSLFAGRGVVMIHIYFMYCVPKATLRWEEP